MAIAPTYPWIRRVVDDKIFWTKNVPSDGDCMFTVMAYIANECMFRCNFDATMMRVLSASRITESTFKDDLAILMGEEPQHHTVLSKCQNHSDLRLLVMKPRLIYGNHLLLRNLMISWREYFEPNFGIVIFHNANHNYLTMPEDIYAFDKLSFMLFDGMHYQNLGFMYNDHIRTVFTKNQLHLNMISVPLNRDEDDE